MIKFLDIGFIPLKKCGMDPVSAAITGGASVIGGIGSAIIGSDSSDSAMEANIAENEKNRKFNHDEAVLQRQWQSDEWDKQFAAQTAQWYSQQDYSNAQAYDYWLKQQAYQSPRQQVIRANQAGFNPSAMAGLGTYGSTGLSASSSSVPSPSVPSGAAASISTSNPVAASQSSDAFSHIASGIGDLVRSVASFRKDSASATQMEQTLGILIEQGMLDIKNKQLVNQYQAFYNTFFSKKAPKELQKLGAEIDTELARRLLMDSETDLNMQKSITEQFQQRLLDLRGDLTKEQWLQAVEITKNMSTAIDLENRLKREQIATEKSKQSQGYAIAFNQRAQGKTWNELRPLQHDLLDIQNKIADEVRLGKRYDNIIRGGALPEACAAFVASCEREHIINSVERKRLERAIKENNFYEVNQFIDWVSTGFDAYRNAGIGTSAFRGFESGEKPAFDPSAGKGFVMDEESGLLFKAPWSK